MMSKAPKTAETSRTPGALGAPRMPGASETSGMSSSEAPGAPGTLTVPLRANTSAFDLYHPAVTCGYFSCILVFTMLAFHPVLTGLSLAAALAEGLALRGWRAVARNLAWLVPLVAVVALANPLFSAAGSTEVLRVGERAVYAESLAYGACMGALLAAVVLWFANASCVLTSGKVLSLTGNALPTVSLMVSMALRLVPQFVRRAAEIRSVQDACTVANGRAPANGCAPAGRAECEGGGHRVLRRPCGCGSAGEAGSAGGGDSAFENAPGDLVSASGGARSSLRERTRANLRLVSVLMGWSMEDSLETADAMRARGWGVRGSRTTYALYRFRARDGVVLGLLVVLAAASVLLAWVAVSQFSFYPRMSTLLAWWGYVPCAVFLFLPAFLEVKEWLTWR